ncbi:MAG: cation transporter [Clostridia bacterium]|nr:cation transporter [Clostridia bacterium]
MNRKQVVERISAISIAVNLILSVGKLAAGVLAHSGAMVSEAVHSASDVFSTVIVIIGFRLSAKDADKEHPYGHERLECVAGIILAMILFITGLGIAKTSVDLMISKEYLTAKMPGIAALIAAVISIAAKEGLYWLTIIYARKIDSPALKADAWHHCSDALSSVGAMIGIMGARMGFAICEPVASLVICVFIIKASVEIFSEAIGKMTDRACDDSTQNSIREIILAQEGVQSLPELKTRMFGAKMYVDAVITVDGELPLTEAHAIAESVHDSVEKSFPGVKHCMVRVYPA